MQPYQLNSQARTKHNFDDRAPLQPYVGQRVTFQGIMSGPAIGHPKTLAIVSVHLLDHDIELNHLLITVTKSQRRQLMQHQYEWVTLSGVVSQYQMPKFIHENGQAFKMMVTTYGIDHDIQIETMPVQLDQSTNAPLSKYCLRQARYKHLSYQTFAQFPNDGRREFWLHTFPERSPRYMIQQQIQRDHPLNHKNPYGKQIPGISARYTVNEAGDVFEGQKRLNPEYHDGQYTYQLTNQAGTQTSYRGAELVARAYLNYQPEEQTITFKDGKATNLALSNLELVARQQPIVEPQRSTSTTIKTVSTSNSDWSQDRRPIPFFPKAWTIDRNGQIYYQNKPAPKKLYTNKKVADLSKQWVNQVDGFVTLERLSVPMVAVAAFQTSQLSEYTNYQFKQPFDPLTAKLSENPQTPGILPRLRAFGNLISRAPYRVIQNHLMHANPQTMDIVVFQDGKIAALNTDRNRIVRSNLKNFFDHLSAASQARIRQFKQTPALYNAYGNQTVPTTNVNSQTALALEPTVATTTVNIQPKMPTANQSAPTVSTGETPTITVRIPQPLRQQLEVRAQQLGLTLSDVIKRGLTTYMNQPTPSIQPSTAIDHTLTLEKDGLRISGLTVEDLKQLVTL